ncbi:MAG TPA: hypothetical protein VKY85_14390 [Candidatus Angelobacter sp.]|nr:hypothetical protein [Candidatus Angelobacter sp.]
MQKDTPGILSSANPMMKAMQRIEAFCGKSVGSEFGSWLSEAQKWPNSAAFLHSLAVAADKDVLFDHLATLRYGLIFKYLGFLLSFEPTGAKGSDLQITCDRTSATVEVTRFRPMNLGPSALSKEEEQSGEWILEPYGDPRRDVAKSLRKVRDKFRQAIAPHAIIAVWNDDEALDELEMSMALCDLKQDPRLPAGLDLVVYGSPWIGRFQLYAFPMKPQLDAPIQELTQQIESVNVLAAINAALSVG